MSIQASEWARRQYVGDAYAKAILRSVADYANDDGLCWPSLGRIADDCELSEATIRRKLKELEDGGWLIRIKCWMDDQGRRNHEGRGRETSHDIRLIFSRTTFRPVPSENVNEGLQADTHALQGDTPPLAVESPPNEPSEEKKEPPQTPPKGGALENEKDEKEFEADWSDFRAAAYPDGIIDLGMARAELRKIPHERRRKAIDGVCAYADYLRRRKQKSKAAHLYIRKGLWEGLSAAPGAIQSVSVHPVHGATARALLTLGRVARYRPLELPGGISYRGEVTPKLLAMAKTPPESEWGRYPRGSPNFAAWLEWINRVFDGCALPSRPEYEAPWPFPPRVDGSIGPPAQSTDPPRRFITDDDAQYIEQEGL